MCVGGGGGGGGGNLHVNIYKCPQFLNKIQWKWCICIHLADLLSPTTIILTMFDKEHCVNHEVGFRKYKWMAIWMAEWLKTASYWWFSIDRSTPQTSHKTDNRCIKLMAYICSWRTVFVSKLIEDIHLNKNENSIFNSISKTWAMHVSCEGIS